MNDSGPVFRRWKCDSRPVPDPTSPKSGRQCPLQLTAHFQRATIALWCVALASIEVQDRAKGYPKKLFLAAYCIKLYMCRRPEQHLIWASMLRVRNSKQGFSDRAFSAASHKPWISKKNAMRTTPTVEPVISMTRKWSRAERTNDR